MKKHNFSTELAYIIGLFILAVGTAFTERADLGVSMVVAPAYILHVKISAFLPFFSFGMAEYTLQALLIGVTALVVRRAKLSYLFSFVTAVLYGVLLDGAIALVSFLPSDMLPIRIPLFVGGMLLCSLGVALLFHTYISLEAYELFVKEVSARYGIKLHTLKTIYDCASLCVAVILSFAFFGFLHSEAIGIGTVVCALLNGTLIRLFTKLIERLWSFNDTFPLRRYF